MQGNAALSAEHGEWTDQAVEHCVGNKANITSLNFIKFANLESEKCVAETPSKTQNTQPFDLY